MWEGVQLHLASTEPDTVCVYGHGFSRGMLFPGLLFSVAPGLTPTTSSVGQKEKPRSAISLRISKAPDYYTMLWKTETANRGLNIVVNILCRFSHDAGIFNLAKKFCKITKRKEGSNISHYPLVRVVQDSELLPSKPSKPRIFRMLQPTLQVKQKN